MREFIFQSAGHRGAFRALAVLATLVGLQACSAGESLKEYVKQGKYQQASTVYNQNPEFFAKEGKKFEGDLGALASALRAGLDPRLRDELKEMKRIRWPASRKSWSGVRRAVQQTQTTLGLYEGHRILSRPQFASPRYAPLKSKYSSIARAIENDASDLFASYDHMRDVRFFDEFPLALEARPFLAIHFSRIRGRLRKANSAQLRRFLSFYPAGSDLSDSDYAELSNIYLRSETRQIAGRSTIGFETYLKALARARGAGFRPDRNGGFSVAFVEIDDGREAARHDFGLIYEIDLPASAQLKAPPNALNNGTARSADFIVVAVPTRADVVRRTVKITRENSKYLDGYVREANPLYQRRLLSMRQAESDLVYLKSEADSMPPPYRIRERLAAAQKAKDTARINRLQRMLNKRRELRHGMRDAKAAYDKLIDELKYMSQYVDVPVHRDYWFERHGISSSKEVELTYWVIDKRRKRFMKSTLRRAARESFNTVANLHERDLHRSDVLGSSDSGAKIDAWETAHFGITLSEITDDFRNKNSSANYFSGIPNFRRDLLKSL